MVQNLEGMGFTVVPFGQGFKDMSPPTKELMKLTLEQRIAHGGHPVLRWNMDNIFVRTDPAGNIKADKKNPRRKLTVRLLQLWHLTEQFAVEMIRVKAYITTEGFYLYKFSKNA